MKVTGIIVEYNPFHNGHLYHINKTRELTNPDVLVAITSGNYCQRGDLSIIDKFEKTKAALNNGVDLLVAGSAQYKGAALLATKGAVASGAGIVHLSSAKEVVDIMPLYLPEAISEIRPGSYSHEMLKKFDAICIGPGLGLDMDAYHCFIDVIENSSCPLIIDADGLTILSNNLELLDRQQRPIILTPHLGEFKRLCDFSGDDQLTEVAINFAKEHHCILVLKGPHTLVTDGKHSYKNASGNKAMAVGGMGDTLAGMMTAFLGGHYEAAILAVYIHGFTGDLIARDHYTVLPEELSKMIPHAMSLIGQK